MNTRPHETKVYVRLFLRAKMPVKKKSSVSIYIFEAALASSEILVESVLIYVIKPTTPFSGTFTPSYNPCATDIVFFNVNPNFLEAS